MSESTNIDGPEYTIEEALRIAPGSTTQGRYRSHRQRG